MASNSYFRLLPDFQYLNPTQTGWARKQYVDVKNLFLRMKVKDSALLYATNFIKYQVYEGDRPDNVAEDLYGSPYYDWVVLLTANIINVRDEWPISSRLLYDYAADKYGENLNATRHYETKEVKDSNGRLILPAGQIVDPGFTIPDPDNIGQTLNPVVSVSNWLVETRKNNEKRSIKVLKKEFLGPFLEEVRSFLQYQESSQYNSSTGKVASDDLI
jgi:hypothetical protein